MKEAGGGYIDPDAPVEAPNVHDMARASGVTLNDSEEAAVVAAVRYHERNGKANMLSVLDRHGKGVGYRRGRVSWQFLVDEVLVRTGLRGKGHRRKAKAIKRCACGRNATAGRGMCGTCYQAARRAS